MFQDCPKCAKELYEKLQNASQQLSTISVAMCGSSNDQMCPTSAINSRPKDSSSCYSIMTSSNNSNPITAKTYPIVGTDLSRCESEEHILEAPGKNGQI